MDLPHEDVKMRILKILTVVCLVSADGHRLVVEAFTHYKVIKKEKYRFETLMKLIAGAVHVESKVRHEETFQTLKKKN